MCKNPPKLYYNDYLLLPSHTTTSSNWWSQPLACVWHILISNKDTTDSPEGSPILEGDVNGVIMMNIMWMKEQMLNS